MSIPDAIAELREKTLVQIQRETAITWAERAYAARVLGFTADVSEYAHEALEHAALTGDDMLLGRVRMIVAYGNDYRAPQAG
jgi:hypothetical protein